MRPLNLKVGEVYENFDGIRRTVVKLENEIVTWDAHAPVIRGQSSVCAFTKWASDFSAGINWLDKAEIKAINKRYMEGSLNKLRMLLPSLSDEARSCAIRLTIPNLEKQLK